MASKFPNTEAFIRRYANQVEQEIETRLTRHKKIASGELYDSIAYELTETKTAISLTFKMAAHGEFVDKGVNGYEQNRGSKYSFKPKDGKGTGKRSKFITQLQKWCAIKGLPKNAAYPIRRNIWKFGIPSTQFFTIPTTRRRKQFEVGIEKNMALDAEGGIVIDLQKAIKGKKNIKLKKT